LGRLHTVGLRKLWFVVERDVRAFMQYKFMLIMRGIWFTAQVALFGIVVNKLVQESFANYFEYYVAGVTIITLYSTAMFIGYDIFEEAEHGVFEYLLTLPLSRRELVLGRSIGGGLRTFVYIGPLLVIVLFILGVANPINLLIALLALFLFAFGVSGMSITIAVGMKSGDKYDILMGVLDALIVRLSTTMYPLVFLQQAMPSYATIATLNPLTYAADLFRWGTGIEGTLQFDPLIGVLALFIFFFSFTFVGVAFYEKRLEGGSWQ
jgi:ABC-2 type transport system permease protein